MLKILKVSFISVLILIVFFQCSNAKDEKFNQQTNNSIIPSSWIGKINMGDSNPELVFNIFLDS